MDDKEDAVIEELNAVINKDFKNLFQEKLDSYNEITKSEYLTNLVICTMAARLLVYSGRGGCNVSQEDLLNLVAGEYQEYLKKQNGETNDQ